MDERRQRLRALLDSGEPLPAPACIDAFSARMVEQAGFPLNYLTGNGAAAAFTGKPDVGLMTMREVVDICRNIAFATSVPFLADADTGYGNAFNVIRTVQEMEAAGVSGIQIEDQVTPKRCGFLPGEIPVVSAREQVGKIRAAIDARTDPNFLLMARTDAAASHGLDEAIRRGNLYKEAGADLLLIITDAGPKELERVRREVPGPLAIAVHGLCGVADLSTEAINDLGYQLQVYAGVVRYTYLKAVSEALRLLRKTGRVKSVSDREATFEEFNAALGIETVREWEKKYLQ